MASKHTESKHDQKKPGTSQSSTNDTAQNIPKPESSSEYEGAPSRKPASNQAAEKKTETSSSSGE